MILDKYENESVWDYECRLSENKDLLDITWKEIADLVNQYQLIPLSPDAYRKHNHVNDINNDCNKNQLTLDLNCDSNHILGDSTANIVIHPDKETIEHFALDPTIAPDTGDVITQGILDLRKERYKNQAERQQINALVRRASREDTIKEIALQAAEIIAKEKTLLFPASIKPSVVDKTGVLLISDWHYGITIHNVFNTYNTEIAKQRVAELQQEVIRIAAEQNISRLCVLNLGDMIAGNIHLPLRINSQIDVITQIMEVSEILAEFLNNLSKTFTIEYHSVLDNHSRIDPNKKDALQLESLARITDWYLAERLKENVNVDMYLDNEFGYDIATGVINQYFNFACVHGDKDKQKNVINKISTFAQQHFDLVCSAHLHHFSSEESNNTLLISNGSLMGTDDYAASLRLNSNPSQTLLIVEDMKVTSINKIDLNS